MLKSDNSFYDKLFDIIEFL